MRFRRATSIGAAALALAGLVTISCGGVTDPSQNQTEQFSGTVQKGACGPVHPFNVSNNGEFTIKVTGFTPTFSSQFLLLYGQPSSDACAAFQQTQALVNFPLSSSILKGAYCTQVCDLGIFPQAETYTMTVSHP